VSDGTPKAKKTTLHAVSLSPDAWALLENAVVSDSTLLYRDPYGRAFYCRIVGDWAASWIKGISTGYGFTTDLPLVEVAQPTTLPVASTVPPGPADS
jgi:hypothetical protein